MGYHKKCVIAFESYPHITSVNSKDNFTSKKKSPTWCLKKGTITVNLAILTSVFK